MSTDKTAPEKPADFPHLRKVTIFEGCAALAEAHAEYCERQAKDNPRQEFLWDACAGTARMIRDKIRRLAKAAEVPPWEELERPPSPRPSEEVRRHGSIGVKE